MRKQYRAYVDGNETGHNLNKARFDELRQLGFHSVAIPLKRNVALRGPSSRSSNHKQEEHDQEETVAFSFQSNGNKRSCGMLEQDHRIASKISNPRERETLVRESSLPRMRRLIMRSPRLVGEPVLSSELAEPRRDGASMDYPPYKRSKIVVEQQEEETRPKRYARPRSSAHLSLTATRGMVPPQGGVITSSTITNEQAALLRYQSLVGSASCSTTEICDSPLS
jgi:hypothetical protein